MKRLVVTLLLLLPLGGATSLLADRASGKLTVAGGAVELSHMKVFDVFGSIQLVIADRSLEGLSLEGIAEAGIQGVSINLERSGEAGEFGLGHVLHADGSEQITDAADLDVERVGELGYRGSLRDEQENFSGDKISFEVSFEFELPDPCAPPEIRFSGEPSPPAQAFADLYSEFITCDIEAAMVHMTRKAAAPLKQELESEQGQAQLEMLKSMLGMAPRQLEIAVTEQSATEATLTVTMTSPSGEVGTEEILVKTEDGEWKVASGLFF